MKKIYYAVALLFLTNSMIAQPGKPDPQFSNTNNIITYVGTNATLRSMVLQPDGKLIAVGNTDSNFVLIRYMQNGTLDNSFGTSGKVITHFNFDCAANAVGVEPDGRIIVAGSSSKYEYATLPSDILVACYNTDGTLNSNFGLNGIVQTNIGLIDYGSAMKVQEDGKIVVTGTSTNIVSKGDIIALRYNDDGSLDGSFGTNGYVITGLGSVNFPSNDIAYTLGVQPDGKLIVGGYTAGSFGGSNMLLLKYLPNGTLDPSFGLNGILSSGSLKSVESLFIKNDGKIVAAGYFNNVEDISVPSVIRLENNGTLDNSFGNNGRILSLPYYSNYEGRLFTVVQQSDGKIIAAGNRTNLSNQQKFESMARYNVNGHKDINFGNNGSLTIPGDQSIYPSNSHIYPVVIRNNGTILMGTDLNDNFIIYKVSENNSSTAIAENDLEQNKLHISVYPNPIREKLFIKGMEDSKTAYLTISDMQGNILKQEQLSNGQISVNVNQLKQGNYVLHILQNNKSASVIFLKQ